MANLINFDQNTISSDFLEMRIKPQFVDVLFLIYQALQSISLRSKNCVSVPKSINILLILPYSVCLNLWSDKQLSGIC